MTTMAALAALALFGNASGVLACDGFERTCTPSVVVWPLFSEAGVHLGVVEAPVQSVPHLAISRFTGQPLTVLYNNPGSLPGSVDPDLHLETLPHARRSTTAGAYPVGY